MSFICELELEDFIKLVIKTNRYQIKEKNVLTPVIPIETGFNLYVYALSSEINYLSISMVIRSAILYELFSITETSSSHTWELNIKNSIHFVTEWLDDLALFNWSISSNSKLLDRAGKPLSDYPFVLDYCKHCFSKIETNPSINSLHYLHLHGTDCARKYNNKDFQKIAQLIIKVKQILHTCTEKILAKGGFEEDVIDDIKNRIKEIRHGLYFIGNKWHKRLKDAHFYKRQDFNPNLEITSNTELYCPQNRTKIYSDLTKLIQKKYRSGFAIMPELEKLSIQKPLVLPDLIRRYFYENEIYYFVTKS